jgi:hypothetical protein
MGHVHFVEHLKEDGDDDRGLQSLPEEDEEGGWFGGRGGEWGVK